jgi:hypothetical protein
MSPELDKSVKIARSSLPSGVANLLTPSEANNTQKVAVAVPLRRHWLDLWGGPVRPVAGRFRR